MLRSLSQAIIRFWKRRRKTLGIEPPSKRVFAPLPVQSAGSMPVVGSIDLERRFVVRIVERVAENYDIEEREFGRVYRWRPASVVTECYCGGKSRLTLSKTTCQVC